MDINQEQAFVRTFVVPEKQERYLQFLPNPKRRNKILQEFYHSLRTISSRTTLIKGADKFPVPVEKLLRSKGAGPTCYLISPDSDLDQQEMPLREALDILIIEDRVAIVCCVASRLAYYKAEDSGFVLEYKPTAAIGK